MCTWRLACAGDHLHEIRQADGLQSAEYCTCDIIARYTQVKLLAGRVAARVKKRVHPSKSGACSRSRQSHGIRESQSQLLNEAAKFVPQAEFLSAS